MIPPLIYVQIASYRDPELLFTIRDCLAKASKPKNLTFGICWQRDQEETLGEFAEDSRFRIFEIPFERSRGPCWARSKTQALFNNEPFTLQIDSHHRFVENWDGILIEMLSSLQTKGHEKPLLSSYAPAYDPLNDPNNRGSQPLRLLFNGFKPEGPFSICSESMIEFTTMSEPEPAHFLSAHFIFTIGLFCKEVPYDPSLYFFGEEPSLAIRAFTNGYDLFHPHKIIIWHHYGRENNPKHWTDHQRWILRNERSMIRYRQIISEGIDPRVSLLGIFGLGTKRTLKDYEYYSGLNFSMTGSTSKALSNLPPHEINSSQTEIDFNSHINVSWEIVIDFNNVAYNKDIEKYDFFYIGAHSQDEDELIRKDLSGADLKIALKEGKYLLELYSNKIPVTWTVWPYNKILKWEIKTTRPILHTF